MTARWASHVQVDISCNLDSIPQLIAQQLQYRSMIQQYRMGIQVTVPPRPTLSISIGRQEYAASIVDMQFDHHDICRGLCLSIPWRKGSLSGDYQLFFFIMQEWMVSEELKRWELSWSQYTAFRARYEESMGRWPFPGFL